MIQVHCACPTPRELPETVAGKTMRCPKCQLALEIVSAEAISDGAGLGDFDASLTVVNPVPGAVARYLLGGVADIEVGKLPECRIVLAGPKVSRHHCKLVRVDFGPSRWKIVDNKSTFGLFVNEQRVSEQELNDGDLIQIGELTLRYGITQSSEIAQPPAPVAAAAPIPGGPVCPSCEATLPRNAKICVDCGIDIKTGRALLTTQGIDENSLYEGARIWIRAVSIIVRVTPLPIPLRSEAYGTRKPYAMWMIAALTIVASFAFFYARYFGHREFDFQRPGNDLMLWSPWGAGSAAAVMNISPERLHRLAEFMSDEERDKLRERFDPQGQMSDEQLLAAMLQAARDANHGEFHWYQLLTHAFLHDTSGPVAFALHLGGNMLFMLVFGTRVNALIGNLATAVVYPILAVCAASIYLLAMGANATGPMLGASGAIMGLAGMYLILFPVHNVICAMWIRFIVRAYRIFPLRGFWILLIYFGYDLAMGLLLPSHGGGGVAHWAHIGGFVTGMVLGTAIVLSRQFDTRGGDLFSVLLGKRAWPLIGKPSQWAARRQQATLAGAGRI